MASLFTSPEASSVRLTTIRKAGQTCGQCNKALVIGDIVTWAPSSPEGQRWRCVGPVNACVVVPQDVIKAKQEDKPLILSPSTPSTTNTPSIASSVAPSTTVEAPASTDANNAFGVLASALTPFLEARLKTKLDASDLENRVASMVESMIASAIETIRPTVRITIDDKIKGEIRKVDGAHPKLALVLAMLRRGKCVYIHGKPGGGKTHSAKQMADALGCTFHPFQVGKLASESTFKGFVDAHGNLAEQDFLNAYESDDAFLFLDEFDRWPTHLQVILNSALANGYIVARGRGMVKRGKNHILAAGNTTMRGRDEFFPEAVAAEQSTMDRFVFIEWPYDEAHEESIALAINPNCRKWVDWIRSIRPEALSGKRGKVFATPRAIYDGAELLLDPTIPVDVIADATVYKGIDSTTKAYFASAYPLPKFTSAERKESN